MKTPAKKKRARRAPVITGPRIAIMTLLQDLKEEQALRERLADLLRQVATALRGKPPPGTLWSFHDLPARAAKAARLAKRARR